MAYNLLKPVHLFTAQSMGTTFTSAAVEIENQDNIGIQLDWTTADAVGTFAVQISSNHREDAEGNIQVPGTWVTLPLSPAIAAAGASDTAYIDLNQMSAMYVRAVYTAGSGTGTASCIVVGKGV